MEDDIEVSEDTEEEQSGLVLGLVEFTDRVDGYFRENADEVKTDSQRDAGKKLVDKSLKNAFETAVKIRLQPREELS